jgi:hypothetical protein
VRRGLPQTEAAGQDVPGDRFLSHRGLIALTVGGSIAEVLVLGWLAPAARLVAPQVTAIAPVAVFHDLRWLFGAGWSWPGFLLGFAALAVARSAVAAAATVLAWPRDQPRPRLPATFGRFLIFTVTASVLLAPVATLLFGIALVPFSWPFLAALPALLLIAVPLAHGGLLGDWWRRLPPPEAVGWLIVSFATLSAAAAAIGALPPAAGVPVAALAGLVNGRTWFGVAAAVTRRETRSPMPGLAGVRAGRCPAWHWLDALARRLWPGPLSPVAAAAAIAVVVGATRVIFALATAAPTAGGGMAPPGRAAAHALGVRSGAAPGPVAPGEAPVPAGTGAAILVVPGFGSSCCAPSAALARFGRAGLVRPFSYRGLSADGQPLPYGRGYTDLPISVLGDRIAAQVRWLHKQTGRPVDIVAESEGMLGVQAMLARHPDLPVDAVALLSPIPDGAGPAADPVPGDALAALVRFAGALSPYGPSGAVRLIASVARDGDASARAAVRHEGQLRVLVMVPLADALTLPLCQLPDSVDVVPALHGSLIGQASAEETVRRFFAGDRVTGPQPLRDTAQLISAAAAAWRMPEVSTSPWACAR